MMAAQAPAQRQQEVASSSALEQSPAPTMMEELQQEQHPRPTASVVVVRPLAILPQTSQALYQASQEQHWTHTEVLTAVQQVHEWHHRHASEYEDYNPDATIQDPVIVVDRPSNPGPAFVEDDDDEDDDDNEDCYECKRVCLGHEAEAEFQPPFTCCATTQDASTIQTATGSSLQQEQDAPAPPADDQLLTTIVKPVPVRLYWDNSHDNSTWDGCTSHDGCSAIKGDNTSCYRAAGPAPAGDPRSKRSSTGNSIPRAIFPSSTTALQTARDGLLLALSAAGGCTDGPAFRNCLSVLHEHYQRSGLDVRTSKQASAGTWLPLTKPVFADCLGENDQGDPLYTLSRMSFDMFRPSSLVCSLQGNFNCVEPTTDVPGVLQDEIQPDEAHSSFCTYNGHCAFTLEPASHLFAERDERLPRDAPPVHRACRGILSTNGYIVADPHTPNRHTLWITSGSMQANDTARDVQRWNEFFQASNSQLQQSAAHQLAAKLLAGVEHKVETREKNFRQSYAFRRALGGHGMAYVDTLYLDRSLRIVRGHRGTLFVFSKMNGGASNNC